MRVIVFYGTSTEEMNIPPKKEVPGVLQWYKGELKDNTHLERAERLAGQKRPLLEDPTLDANETVQNIQPFSKDLRAATKQLRQFPGSRECPLESQELRTMTKIKNW